MELNAEQIKKALECCTSEVTIEFNCTECPYIGKGCNIVVMRDALSLIKELTEENEKLTINMNAYGLTAKRLGEKNEWLTENYRKLKSVTMSYESFVDGLIPNEELIADTVRKMHSEIEARCIKGGIYPAFVKSTIDQIAKEILEGEK